MRPRADDDGDLGGLHVETVEQFLRRPVGIEIDVGVRKAIAAEKLAQIEGLGGVARAHQDDRSPAAANQLQPAQNEGAQQDLAQLGVLRDQDAQRVAADLEKLAGFGHAAPHQGALSGDHGDLAGEFAGSVRGDGTLTLEGRLHDFHGAREQHEERNGGVAWARRGCRRAAPGASGPKGGCGRSGRRSGSGNACVRASRALGRKRHIDFRTPAGPLGHAGRAISRIDRRALTTAGADSSMYRRRYIRSKNIKRGVKMTVSSPDPEWKKGSAELLVLSLLEDQPRHGYDISKLIQLRSGGALRFHVTSLYPLLHRLEKEGWIEGRWVEKAEQRRRRYYKLTPQGRKCFAPSRRAGRISSPLISRITGIEHA